MEMMMIGYTSMAAAFTFTTDNIGEGNSATPVDFATVEGPSGVSRRDRRI